MRFGVKVDIIFKRNMWVVAVIEFKRHVIAIGIFGIIIYKLNHWQEMCLVILFSVYKNFKVCFYYAILSFYLAINLRIEGCREFLLDF